MSKHFQIFPAISSQFYLFLVILAFSSHIQPFPAIFSHSVLPDIKRKIKPFQLFQPFAAASSPCKQFFSHSSDFYPFQYFQLFLTISSHFLQFPVDQSCLAIPRHSSYFKLFQAFSSHFKPIWPFQPCSAISSIGSGQQLKAQPCLVQVIKVETHLVQFKKIRQS